MAVKISNASREWLVTYVWVEKVGCLAIERASLPQSIQVQNICRHFDPKTARPSALVSFFATATQDSATVPPKLELARTVPYHACREAVPSGHVHQHDRSIC